MKRLIIVLICALPTLMVAQKSGSIKYVETIKMNIELPDDIPEEMKKRIPKERKHKKELLFNETASVYKDVPLTQEEIDRRMERRGGRGGGPRMRMMGNRDNQMYIDLKTKEVVEKRDFMDKTFLIEGEAEKKAWKMTGKQKKILDYMCMQATFTDSLTTEVWFTPQIPASVGPGMNGGLPGAILELNYNDGERVVMATAVTLEAPADELMIKPTKGKKVTDEEFREIVETKMKEMREQYGGRGGKGGMMIIRQ